MDQGNGIFAPPALWTGTEKTLSQYNRVAEPASRIELQPPRLPFLKMEMTGRTQTLDKLLAALTGNGVITAQIVPGEAERSALHIGIFPAQRWQKGFNVAFSDALATLRQQEKQADGRAR